MRQLKPVTPTAMSSTILHGWIGDQLVRINLREAFSTIDFDGKEVFSFDAEGRWLSWWVPYRTYLRGLDNRVVEKWSDSAGRKQFRDLVDDEKAHLAELMQERLHPLKAGLHEFAGASRVNRGFLFRHLERILAWNPSRLEGEYQRFHALYRPVGIVPPDRYLSVVLQLTEGCHWNRCLFCELYRNTPFRMKTSDEVRAHIQGVKRFFGKSLLLRRSLFLSDANALMLPHSHLIEAFQNIGREFPGSRSEPFRDGISSFLDVAACRQKPVGELRELAELGLRRIYLGVETGSDALLRWLRKPHSTAGALEAVRKIKAAGVPVGVIFLAGAGGRRFAAEHIASTVELVHRMDLDAQDIVYLSPLRTAADSEYAVQAHRDGVGLLSEAESCRQLEWIRLALTSGRGVEPRIARYDLKEFIY
ncbi:MAG: radical SAM protein [Acidobacteriota bacterium]